MNSVRVCVSGEPIKFAEQLIFMSAIYRHLAAGSTKSVAYFTAAALELDNDMHVEMATSYKT